MPLIKVGRMDDLPPGTMIEAQVHDRPVAVCNVNGQIFCVDGICPHAGGPLAGGALHGSILVCPWHGWEFDCTTGQADVQELRLATFPVHLQDDEILIEHP